MHIVINMDYGKQQLNNGVKYDFRFKKANRKI